MKRQYPLHELSDTEFEDVVWEICQDLLGAGTLKFAKGNDGGRDSRFNGTANRFPSEKSPWAGKIVIQAKHTSNPSTYLSSGSFINKEYDKIKKLVADKELDYYLIFTNRKGSAEKAVDIRKEITNTTSILFDNIEILVYEHLNEYLINNNRLVKKYLAYLLEPIRFYEEDIKNIIIYFKDNHTDIKELKEEAPSPEVYLDKEKKNELNKLSKDYFNRIVDESHSYFTKIREFLGDPKNEEHREAFLATASDLKDEIALHMDEYDRFEEVIIKIKDMIISKYPDELKPKRRFVNVFLHYMYWDCFIGKKQ